MKATHLRNEQQIRDMKEVVDTLTQLNQQLEPSIHKLNLALASLDNHASEIEAVTSSH